MEPVGDKIAEAFARFIHQVRDMVAKYHEDKFPNLAQPTISFTTGKRYWKIVKDYYGQRAVYCFVDRTNGDILKAATWRAPAKHARGNILDDNPMKAVNEHGAVYLR